MLITDAAVREAAANLAQSLGGGWMIDTAAPADGAAHLVYNDGRGISFRPIFGGTTVQLWITGSAAPPLPDDATLADHARREAQLAARLAEGHRYNKATTLVTEADEDPELIILRTLEDDLLPAFDYKPRYVGHRPWIDLFDSALSQVMGEAPPAAGTSLRDCGPEAHAMPHSDGEDTEPGTDAVNGTLIEHSPTSAPDGDREAETSTADMGRDGASSSIEELEFAQSSNPEPGSAAEPRAADEIGAEDSDQPADEAGSTAKRRPQATKRRPKTRAT